MLPLLALLSHAFACQPRRDVHWLVFPALGAALPANGRVVLVAYNDDGFWPYFVNDVGLSFGGAASAAPPASPAPPAVPATPEPILPGADPYRVAPALRPASTLTPGVWTLRPTGPFDAEIADDRISAAAAARGSKAFGLGPALEPVVAALPTRGWTVTATMDLVPPEWTDLPIVEPRTHPECWSAGGGPGWPITVRVSEPVVIAARLVVDGFDGDGLDGSAWSVWPATWADGEARFVARGAPTSGVLEVWALDVAGNATAAPLRFRAEGEELAPEPAR